MSVFVLSSHSFARYDYDYFGLFRCQGYGCKDEHRAKRGYMTIAQLGGICTCFLLGMLVVGKLYLWRYTNTENLSFEEVAKRARHLLPVAAICEALTFFLLPAIDEVSQCGQKLLGLA